MAGVTEFKKTGLWCATWDCVSGGTGEDRMLEGTAFVMAASVEEAKENVSKLVRSHFMFGKDFNRDLVLRKTVRCDKGFIVYMNDDGPQILFEGQS
jgi:hypothetical protein